MSGKKIIAPKHLKANTRKWFISVCETYDLEPHHIKLLTLAAETLDRCQGARQVIAKNGATFIDKFGQPKPRPEIAIERDSRIAFARLLRELNLDTETPETPRPPGLKY